MLKVKKIKPMFNRILVTANRYEKDVKQGGVVIITEGTFKEYQEVLSVGESVKDIKEGDIVHINPIRYAVKKHTENTLKDGVVTDNPTVSYNLNLVEVGDDICMMIYDQDVDYVITDFIEEEEQGPLILPEKKEFKLN